MANLPIKNNPTLNLQMEALTTSTPAHADRFNERYQQLGCCGDGLAVGLWARTLNCVAADAWWRCGASLLLPAPAAA